MGDGKAFVPKLLHTRRVYLQNGPAYCEAFLNVLRNVTKEEAVEYVLALIDDMLSGATLLAQAFPCCGHSCIAALISPPDSAVDPLRAQLFHQESDVHLANLPDPYSIFLR